LAQLSLPFPPRTHFRMHTCLPLGPRQPHGSYTEDVGNLGMITQKMGNLRNLVDNFGLPSIEHDKSTEVLTENLGSKWVDNFSLPCVGHGPSIMTDDLSMQTLVEQIMFTQSSFTKCGKKECKRYEKKSNRKSPGKIQELDMWGSEPADPKLSPAYVKLHGTMKQADKSSEGLLDDEDCTTVVIKNIPRYYTMDHLFQELSELGFGKSIDYMNLLEDKRGGKNRGYAFVNFLSHELALQCMESIEGHDWKRTVDGATEVQQGAASWALVQGFAANNSKHPMVAIVSEGKLGPWRVEGAQCRLACD